VFFIGFSIPKTIPKTIQKTVYSFIPKNHEFIPKKKKIYNIDSKN
jgi:hypothetical protein